MDSFLALRPASSHFLLRGGPLQPTGGQTQSEAFAGASSRHASIENTRHSHPWSDVLGGEGGVRMGVHWKTEDEWEG